VLWNAILLHRNRAELNIIGVGTFPPHPGGSALSFFDILDRCAKRGHRIRVLAPIAESSVGVAPRRGEYSPRLDLTRFPVPYFQKFNQKPAASDEYSAIEGRYVRQILPHMIQEDRPDLLFLGREIFAAYVPEIAARSGLPCVLRIAGGTTRDLLQGSFSSELTESLLDGYSQVDLMVSPARHMAERMTQLGFHSVRVIPNAIDTERFNMGQRDRQLTTSLNIDEHDIVVAHVSNLQKLKRPMDLVSSANQALRQNPSLLYLFIGDGIERAALEARCASLGITERVRFAGWVAYGDMPAYYRLADMVVMPAEDDTLPCAYLEAQACGCVLISSDIPAAREVLIHNESGLLFPTGKVDALTELTLAIAADPERRARIGQNARVQVRKYSLDEAVESYIGLFRSLTGRRTSQTGGLKDEQSTA
jgi:glycosyltransferase involved in cell wall biosynthesis